MLASNLNYLQWKNVTISSLANSNRLSSITKALSLGSVLSDVSLESNSFMSFPMLLLWDCGSSVNFSEIVGKPADSVLVVTEDCQDRLELELGQVPTPASLYSTSWNHLLEGTFFRLLTTRQDGDVKKCQMDFRLSSFRPSCLTSAMGSKMEIHTLPYAPFIDLHNCSNSTLECQLSGMTFDLLKLISLEGNFTWVGRKEPSKDRWGAWPTRGNSTERATGLALRTLERGTDLPLAPWTITQSRSLHADQTFSFFTESLNCFNDPSHFHNPDKAFLARPLRADAWYGIRQVK